MSLRRLSLDHVGSGVVGGVALRQELCDVRNIIAASDDVRLLLFRVGLPRGGALCPAAVGPSTMNPSTRPLAFFAKTLASVTEATIARNFGRSSHEISPPLKAIGSNRVTKLSALVATLLSTFRSF